MHKQCLKCHAKCCRYFCFQIDAPDSYVEFEQIRWYLTHENISVHIDTEGDWMILIENRCKWLQDTPAGGRCVNYRNRPLICRGFSPTTCDFTEGAYEFEEWFNTPEEIEAYARRMLGEDEFMAARKKTRGRGGERKRGRRRKDAETRGRGDAGKKTTGRGGVRKRGRRGKDVKK